MRILVADDDALSAEVLIQSLKAMDHDVVYAMDGRQAWDLLQKEPFRLVLLDWMMPEMDGMEVCRNIRSTSTGSYTYIILVTGRTDRKDRLEALEGGADDFLTKPLDSGELIARLNVANRILETEEAIRLTNQALETAHKNEIELGSAIQSRLLYTPPPRKTKALESASISFPSQHVDGDFCDFFTLGTDVVDVFVGDVMGKGVPAALVGAGVKAGLQRCLIKLVTSPDSIGLPSPIELIQCLHKVVCGELIELGTFLTLCYARVDAVTDTVTYVNCGHPRIIQWDASKGKTKLLETTNVPLGFSASEEYRQTTSQLEPGDLLIFYSDGVTDLKMPDGKRLGVERFAEWVNNRGHLPLEAFLSEVKALRAEGLADNKAGDDFTCVAIRYRGVEREENGTLRLWADKGSLRKIRKFVSSAAKSSEIRFTPEESSELLLAVQEAASNAVRHARPTHQGIPINITAVAGSHSFTVKLQYPGESFEPDTVPAPVLDGTTENGFGISIIKKCVDDVNYSQEGDQNLVVLKKKVKMLE